MMKKLQLPDVTLFCVFTEAHDLSRMAVQECTSRVDFGDVLVFTDKPGLDELCLLDKKGSSREETVRNLGEFTYYELPKYIKTSHVLMIQWDSWVVNAAAWRPEFLQYDYIGAPWWYREGLNVGNSGFCLRSKRLMDFLDVNRKRFPLILPAEDHFLCRNYQLSMPQFTWAPEDLAYRFSFERTWRYPDDEVFGFHGIFNWPRVLSRAQIAERLAKASDYVRGRPEYRELMYAMATLKPKEGQPC